jgi:hypothetical protein
VNYKAMTLPMMVLCVLALASMGAMYFSAQFVTGQLQVVLVSDFFGIATGLIGAFTALLKQDNGVTPIEAPKGGTVTQKVENTQTVTAPAEPPKE